MGWFEGGYTSRNQTRAVTRLVTRLNPGYLFDKQNWNMVISLVSSQHSCERCPLKTPFEKGWPPTGRGRLIALVERTSD